MSLWRSATGPAIIPPLSVAPSGASHDPLWVSFELRVWPDVRSIPSPALFLFRALSTESMLSPPSQPPFRPRSLAHSLVRARSLGGGHAGHVRVCVDQSHATPQSIQQSSAGRQLSLTGASARLAVVVLPLQSDIPALRRAALPPPSPGHHAQPARNHT
jgi:hypothetical protein